MIGAGGLAFTAVNIAIGAGIFIMPAILAKMLGPGAVLVDLLCGVATILVMACFVEISSEVKRTGGPLAALEEILGTWPGFLCWLLYGLYALAAGAFLSLALSDSLGFHGAARLVCSATVVTLIAALNAIGVRHGLRFALITTVAKLIPLALVIVGGAFIMNRTNLRIPAWPASHALGSGALAMFFAFAGTETALLPAGELKDPRTTVPRAIFAAVVMLTVIYASVQWVSQGVLGSNMRATAPLADVAAASWGPIGRTIVRIGTSVSILGCLSGCLLAVPRWAFLGARMRALPAGLGQVNLRYQTPLAAIIATSTVVVLISLSGALERLTALMSASILVVYLAACLAVLRRTRNPDGFHVPGARTIAIAGAMITVYMLAHLSAREFVAISGAVALGILYRAAGTGWRKPEQVR